MRRKQATAIWSQQEGQPRRRHWIGALFVAVVALFMVAATTYASPNEKAAADTEAAAGQNWPMFGQSLDNTGSQNSQDTNINVGNAGNLKPKWTFTTGSDVSARAAVVNGIVYFPDWSGHLYAVNAHTGSLVWSSDILTSYLSGAFASPPAEVISRTTPYVDPSTSTMYIGTQQGGWLLAINTANGALRWKSQLDTHPYAIDSASPVVYQGVVYVGVSSTEETAANDPSYQCCTFRGSVVALDASTGAREWKTYMVPSGYTGGAVWGSTIVPDPARGVVYTTTGNNYSVPTDPAYTSCVSQGGTEESCLSPDDHFDSIVALRMSSGTVAWSQRLSSGDDWNLACRYNTGNCPQSTGQDYDFGSGVNLFTVHTASGYKTMLGVGQKSGIYSAFDPSNNGALLWATQVGPGGELGGIMWGSATDCTRIYVAISNYGGPSYTLQPSGQTTSGGSWSALDPATGKILWQTADPGGASDQGPMAVANGVVYAPSMAGTGNNMYALNASTGAVLWGYPSGGSVLAGAAIANGVVFWGSGYRNIPGFTGNNKFYAFSLGGQ